jgi:FkbM family methyltransferase
MNKFSGKFSRVVKAFKHSKRFKKFQIPFKEVYLLQGNNEKKNSTILFGKSIKITNSFWYLHGIQEIFIDEVYNFYCNEDNPVIIDCGSNIGLSIIYFKKLYPNAQIIGFEPDKFIFKVLQNNLLQFSIKDAKLFDKAVWINEKPLLFKRNGSVGGHLSDIEDNDTERVETVRLKDFLHTKVDFLKIDIEGAEFEIIKDCEEKLNNVSNIFIEYHSFHYNPQMIGELLIILKNAGFKVYIKEAWENMKKPFLEKKGPFYDTQLNIFGYRIN